VSRAIVFDLDQTLYPERRFALSGFASVAREVERLFGIPARDAFSVLRRALVEGRRDRALQGLCAQFGLPLQMVGEFRSLIRMHKPSLRLPRESAVVLRALRIGWRIGILTNGLPITQANKVTALGLADRVDAVVYAEDTGAGKPDPAAFEAIVDQLGIRATETVFVGDDPWCDVFGARRAGMKTIQVCRARVARRVANDADAIVGALGEVPDCARMLLGEVTSREVECHAAHC
jgi:putative hydrolase of the HAD superfamily